MWVLPSEGYVPPCQHVPESDTARVTCGYMFIAVLVHVYEVEDSDSL